MLDDTEPTVLEQDDHEWPDKLPAHQRRVSGTAYTRVRPDLVVEVSADLALDGLRWRHPVRLVRRARTRSSSGLGSITAGPRT